MRTLRSFLLLLLVPAAAIAQEPDPVHWTGSHEIQLRWLHARQDPDLTPFSRSVLPLRIDSIGRAGGERTVAVLAGRGRRGTLRIGPRGDVVEAWVEPHDMSGLAARVEPARALSHRMLRSLEEGGGVLLDDTRLWDIVPFLPPALRPGAISVDTLRLRAARYGFLQSLEGPRVTTLLRDTVVNGARLWIGRDSARVEYRERLLKPSRTLDTTVVVERVGHGTLQGRFLYDPELGLFRSRQDTLEVSGEALLREPGGAVRRTSASYERRVAWTLRSPAEQREWLEERERERRRSGFSIVQLPSTPLEHRLAGGDTAAADSLVRAWSAADPDERRRIDLILGHASDSIRPRLDSLRLAAGDWAVRAAGMSHRVWAGPPLDSAEMAEYLRLLRDPDLAFERRIDTDPLYGNLAGGLVQHPATLDAPAQRTACTPAACRLVAGERNARDPRLRKVALVASFILEPERWVDSLLARPDTASHLLSDAVHLARGVGATWPADDKRPIPPPGADWREWLRWTGVDPDEGAGRGELPGVRFRSSHAYAIRMTERLTGRDIGAELAAAAEAATDEAGRTVFRALALRLGSVELALDEVLAWLRSGDDAERTEAFTALNLVRHRREPADSALRHEIVGQLLAQVVDGDSIWVPAPGYEMPREIEREDAGESVFPLYLEDQNVPDPLRAAWSDRGDVEVVTWEEWRGQPSRSPGLLLRVGEVTTLGPLAWITIERWVRSERAADESPRGWASREEYLLIRTAEGWMVIPGGRGVT